MFLLVLKYRLQVYNIVYLLNSLMLSKNLLTNLSGAISKAQEKYLPTVLEEYVFRDCFKKNPV